MVERNLAKVEVASSRLVSRSKYSEGKRCVAPFSLFHFSDGVSPSCPMLFGCGTGGVAEWLCSGLQSRVRRFDSDPRLQNNQ